MNQVKKVHLEVIRVIAVLCIIFNHTDGFIYYTVTDNEITYLYSLIFAVLCRNGVPLFFMISGALLLAKEESFKVLFKKRILRIFTVLTVISLFYYLFDICRYGVGGKSIGDFIFKLSSCEIRESLWFLYEYMAIMLLLPFFRKMVQNAGDKLFLYLCLLKIGYGIIVPAVNGFLGTQIVLFSGFVGDYFFYLLMGFFIENRFSEIYGKKTGYIGMFALIICTCLSVLHCHYDFMVGGTYRSELLDELIFISAPCIFILMKRWCVQIKEKGKIQNIILTMGGCSFGIYLTDNFVRWQLLPLYLFLSKKTFGILANSVYVVSVFLVGMLYTFLLKKIPAFRKYLGG